MIVKHDSETKFEDPTGDLIEQCQIMLRFAMKEGLPTDASLRSDIARLDRALIKANLPPISDVSPELIKSENPQPSAGEATARVEPTGVAHDA